MPDPYQLEAADFADARPRWLAGRCPCCGGAIIEYEYRDVVTRPRVIAEGVEICGRCVANDHLSPDGFTAMLLASLVP